MLDSNLKIILIKTTLGLGVKDLLGMRCRKEESSKTFLIVLYRVQKRIKKSILKFDGQAHGAFNATNPGF